MKNLLLIGLVIVTSQTFESEAEAGLFRNRRCSSGRVKVIRGCRIFRSRCRVIVTRSCTTQSATPTAPTTEDAAPPAPDTTTNQQVPEIAPPPPVESTSNSSGPPAPEVQTPAPAVQSSKPENTVQQPPPAPVLKPEKPFRLLDPNLRTLPPAPSNNSPFVAPDPETEAAPTSPNFELLGFQELTFKLLGQGDSSPFLLVRSP